MVSYEKLIRESMEFQSKLTEGARTISNIGEIKVGQTPKDVVLTKDRLELHHFRKPTHSAISQTNPLLIVYALVNRPYITDLHESRSLVRGLLNQGADVYLIDWGYPQPADRNLDLPHYLNYIDSCVDAVVADSGASQVNILGICQGGTMSLCYSVLHPTKVENLITMVTPVDFHTPDNTLSRWFKELDVDLLVSAVGNVPGMMLNSMFLSLKPYKLGMEKYLDFAKIVDQPAKVENFMRMEKWIFDSPDQAGAMFATFIKDFFQENKLINKELKVEGRLIDLECLEIPILNIYAKHDHLVPPSASQALRSVIGSQDYGEATYDTGHIGIYVSSKAGKDIPIRITSWLEERSNRS